MKPRIALSGKMRSGKSTLAKALATHFNLIQDSFAFPLNQALLAMGVSREDERYRHFAQGVGGVINEIEDGFFAELMGKRHTSFEYGLVIDDLRRRAEYDWCQANGFYLIRLFAPEYARVERGAEWGTLHHHTEVELSKGHFFWNAVYSTDNQSTEEIMTHLVPRVEKHFASRVYQGRHLRHCTSGTEVCRE